MPPNLLLLSYLALFAGLLPTATTAKPSLLSPASAPGASRKRGPKTEKKNDAYRLLARSIQRRLNAPPPSSPESDPAGHDVAAISSALRSLSATQTALKKIDGTAHEVYQRTHKSTTSFDDGSDDGSDDGEESDGDGDGDGGGGGGHRQVAGLKVSGRMTRNAARVGCIADALFAAELCELNRLAPPANGSTEEEGEARRREADVFDEEGTLASWTGRRVILNTTISAEGECDGGLSLSVLVIHEPHYTGGAGIGHGGVDDLLSFAKEDVTEEREEEEEEGALWNATEERPVPRGRYLVILSDHAARSKTTSSDLPSILSILDTPPFQVGGTDGQVSVCEPLYQVAGDLIRTLGPVLLNDGLEATKEGAPKDDDDSHDEDDTDGENVSQQATIDDSSAIHFVGYSLAGGVAAIAANILDGSLPQPKSVGEKTQPEQSSSWCGAARSRTSALCLGAPPCLSATLPSPFCISIIHGDDVVCRSTRATLDRLCERARRALRGGVLGRGVGWMSEAASLAAAGIRSSRSAAADKDAGGRLVVPGRAFLVRPRRLGGGSSSIHEVGGPRGGREALRAALLWQLHDVLLSRSLWAHHQLEAYIRSLDKVRLKGFADAPSDRD